MAKHCITCDQPGHTYLECDKVSFGSLFCGALGVVPIVGPTLDETAAGIIEIEKVRELHALAGDLGYTVSPATPSQGETR